MNTREVFGQALRRIRKDRGTPARMLADALNMSESRLFQLERAELRPNPDDGPRIDEFYGVPAGLYTWMAEISRTAREPFGSLLAYEARAKVIRIWELRMIPGLFQTSAYAMVFMQDEKAVEERLARREKVFGKAEPAAVRAVIDEAALRRNFGSREIMAEQLEFLIAEDAPWQVHVLPASVYGHPAAADGPVMLLDLEETALAYGQGWRDLESIMDGPDDVRKAWETWDAVLGLSLTTDASRELIKSIIGELT